MIYFNNLRNIVLLEPISRGADSLKIISGYATHTMASWHIKEIAEKACKPIDITLIVGMCGLDGITKTVHDGFKNIVDRNGTPLQSSLRCQYVVNGTPVHSKLYLWEKSGEPFQAFMGSANYTQSAFSTYRREILQECDIREAVEYFNSIEPDTVYCNHSEIEDKIMFTSAHQILDAENISSAFISGSGIQSVTLSLLSRNGETGAKSGLNWGQRNGREPNQAYIPLPVQKSRSGFFPLGKQHFSVLTDDGVNLVLRVEQENNKAITTPLNNSLIGEYFRSRIGIANGAYVWKRDLENYGRTDVTFYKIDEEQFYMDFSV